MFVNVKCRVFTGVKENRRYSKNSDFTNMYKSKKIIINLKILKIQNLDGF